MGNCSSDTRKGSPITQPFSTNRVQLPDEILEIIILHITDPQSFVNLCQSCKHIYGIIQEPHILQECLLNLSKIVTAVYYSGQGLSELAIVRRYNELPSGAWIGDEVTWVAHTKISVSVIDGKSAMVTREISIDNARVAESRCWNGFRKMTGKEMTSFPYGGVRTVRNRNSQGELHGEQLTFWENGTLSSRSFREDGLLTGIFQYWRGDGSLIFVRTYYKGFAIGEEYHWDSHGNITVKHNRSFRSVTRKLSRSSHSGLVGRILSKNKMRLRS